VSGDLRTLAAETRRTLDDVRAAQRDNDQAATGGMRKARKVPWGPFFRAVELLISAASK
jgi:hypothetical protein